MELEEKFEVDQKDVFYLAEMAFHHRNRKTIGHLSHSQQIAVALIQGRHRDNWLQDLGYEIENLDYAWLRIGQAWAFAIAPARVQYNKFKQAGKVIK